MGCCKGTTAKVATVATVQMAASPPKESPKKPRHAGNAITGIGDFYCEDCDELILDANMPHQHRCRGQKRSAITVRRETCSICIHNVDGKCTAVAGEGDIETGIRNVNWRCPNNHWQALRVTCPRCEAELVSNNGISRCEYCRWQGDPWKPAPTVATPDELPADCVVITAANQAFMRGAYFMLWTLLHANDVKAVLYVDNVPANDPHVQQIRSWGVTIKQQPQDVPASTKQAQTWNKAATIADAMAQHERVLWLDSDVSVAGSVAEIFESIACQPFAPDHGTFNAVNNNRREMKQLFGKPARYWAGRETPCAGILGFASGRDTAFVEEWRRRCRQMVSMEHLWSDDDQSKNACKWFDQGMLQDMWMWDTHDGQRYSEFACKRKGTEAELMIQTYAYNSLIYHYGGPTKPWYRWPEVLDWGKPK